MTALLKGTRPIAALAAVLTAACSPGDPGLEGARDAAPKIPLAEARSASASPSPAPQMSAPAPASALPAAKLSAAHGMARVPAGPFTMGADHEGELDERPAHVVTLPAFDLDLTEVTNEDYERCVEAGACALPDSKSAERNHFGSDARFRSPRRPVSSISWESARGYCAWAGKRLPTEAEWEKAARGADGRRFPWGAEEPTPDRAVYGVGTTAEVGTHPRGDGPYGHHDLAGNVWEWVEDAYDPYAYVRHGAPHGAVGSCDDALAALAELRSHGKQGFTGSNPIPVECERVLRGGAFNYALEGLRSSNRVHHPPRFRLIMSGFRCARDADSGGP